MACRDWYRGARDAAVRLGRSQGGFITSRQLGDLMPEEITDRQIYRWLAALQANGIRIRNNEELVCAP